MGAKGPSRTLDTAATLIYVTDCRITEICPLEDIFIRPLEWLTASVFLFKTIISLTANMFCRAVLWCDITDGQVKKLFRPGGKKKCFARKICEIMLKDLTCVKLSEFIFLFQEFFFFKCETESVKLYRKKYLHENVFYHILNQVIEKRKIKK